MFLALVLMFLQMPVVALADDGGPVQPLPPTIDIILEPVHGGAVRGRTHNISVRVESTAALSNTRLEWEMLDNSAGTVISGQQTSISTTLQPGTATHSAIASANLLIALNEAAEYLRLQITLFYGTTQVIRYFTLPVVDEILTGEARIITVRARGGGEVALGDGTYGAVRIGSFVAGQRVQIHARPLQDFFFDSWDYFFGMVDRDLHASTYFTMPDRDLTVWANFRHYRDGRYGYRDRLYFEWDTGPFTEVPVGLPSTPQPFVVQQLPQGPQGLPYRSPIQAMPIPTIEEVPEVVPVPLTVNLNGRPLNITGQPAVMVGNAQLIPVGDVFRALGYNVAWNPATSTATLTRGNVVVVVTEGSNQFTINGMSRSFRTPAMLMNGYLMVSFMEIIEAIGGRAHRDANNAINIFVTR
jgi:adhesin HecA-like repeat protein